MIHIGKTQYTRDAPNKKITVVRDFAAPLENIWDAWTKSEILDQWWAPKPWKTETKRMDFRPGGMWLYCMAGPDGTRSWVRVDYKTIQVSHSFESSNVFCDEHGNTSNELPEMHWKNEFHSTDTGSRVVVEISFDTEADLHTLVKMGFEGGFSMAHGNLDELLAQ